MSTFYLFFTKRINFVNYKFLILIFLTLLTLEGYAQKIYATTTTTDGTVLDENNTMDEDESTFAILEAKTGLIIGLGSSPASVELEYSTTIPANTTTFVRIETQENILSSLLGGTLGNLLADLVGTILTGVQEFSVEAINSTGTTVLSGASQNPSSFAGEQLKVVIDKNNHTYLAITPNHDYQSIKITNRTGALLGLGATKTMKVYDAFYYDENIDCRQPVFTSYDGTGISLELLNLGGGVSDMERSIDQSDATYSTLSLGVVSVLSTLTQRAYFEGPSTTGDVFGIRLSFDPALLTINLGQQVQIITYLGGNLVTSQTLQSLLTPAMITQIQNGLPIDVHFTPTGPIDRVNVQLSGILDVTLVQSLRIHEFYHNISVPILDAASEGQTVCEGTSADLIASSSVSTNEIRWYNSLTGNTVLFTTESGEVFNTGPLNGNTTFYLASAVPGCPDESTRIPVEVLVTPGPTPDPLAPLLPISQCAIDTITIDVTSQFSDEISWFENASSTTPILDGDVNGSHTYHVNNGVLGITGASAVDSPITLYIGVEDPITGCITTPDDYLSYTVNVLDEPTPTTSNEQQEFCLNTSPTIADLDITGTAIQWYDAAVNGVLLSSTETLQNGTSYFATSTGTECESSVSLEVQVTINDETPPTTSQLAQQFCFSENPTLADLSVNETDVNWYDANGNALVINTPLTDSTTYYATLQGAVCESSDSLAIDVTVINLTTPTGETTQDFCLTENPTVGDLQMNESNIVWYDAAVAGNVVDNTTLLTNGSVYYAATEIGICESPNRTAVTVNIITVPTPTTADTTQSFCSQGIATVADLQTNEPNVIWYNSEGTVLMPTTPLQTGSYYGVFEVDGCQSSVQLQIDVTVGTAEAAELFGEFESACYLDTTIYYAPVGMSNYQWSIAGGTIVAGGTTTDNHVSVVWNAVVGSEIALGYTNTTGCWVETAESMTVSLVYCSDLTIHKTVNNFTPAIGQNITFTITVTNNGNDVFNNVEVIENLQSGFTFLSYEASHGTYNSTTGLWTIPVLGANEIAVLNLVAKVNPTGVYTNIAMINLPGGIDDYNNSNNSHEIELDPGCFMVYNEISPNGDGVNDYLIIDCIEYYSNNSVTIFNRYGTEVFASESYKNDWDGVANSNGTIGKGEPLPQGTYFYVLKVEDADVETSGWIYIVR